MHQWIIGILYKFIGLFSFCLRFIGCSWSLLKKNISIYSYNGFSSVTIKSLIIFFSLNDVATNWQFMFQDPATSKMEGIIDLHHDIMFFIVWIIISVIWVMFEIVIGKQKDCLAIWLFVQKNHLLLVEVESVKRWLFLCPKALYPYNYLVLFWYFLLSILILSGYYFYFYYSYTASSSNHHITTNLVYYNVEKSCYCYDLTYNLTETNNRGKFLMIRNIVGKAKNLVSIDTIDDIKNLNKMANQMPLLNEKMPYRHSTVSNYYLREHWGYKLHSAFRPKHCFSLEKWLESVSKPLSSIRIDYNLHPGCIGKLQECNYFGTLANNRPGVDSIEKISDHFQFKTSSTLGDIHLGTIAQDIRVSHSKFSISECGRYIVDNNRKDQFKVIPLSTIPEDTKLIINCPTDKNGVLFNRLYSLDYNQVLKKSKLTSHYCPSTNSYSISARISAKNWKTLIEKDYLE